ncbi:probable RNA-directed DNA polymerase from transposon X-element [Trichonephila clavipes]|uniref:Probable RNA-directed DNA polymerase from transposon X-element n=1 Tax=Trichonephila clavipes TaxID=2585209 RepID=A0A8X7BC77_TRICX|nr:probable RNA-directed DNA polymerase from transposon X-element [Trichonephila clavipes]
MTFSTDSTPFSVAAYPLVERKVTLRLLNPNALAATQTNGNILSNWAVGSAIDIIAPDTPTHFNHNAPSTVIDIGFAANFSHSNVFTVNELSSDHNPVIFDFVTNCQLPPLLQTLKTTNWIKFQEIPHYNMPGNPTIDNLDQAVQNFSNIVSDAINTSTSTRISKTSHLRLPINIRELIKTKNRFRKLWNNTRYPLYKREVNALVRQIRNEINEHKNRTWKNLLPSLNVEDNSLYTLHKRITKKYTVIPPLHGPSGMAFSDFEKAEAFKDTLEVTFQENAEPYSDDKIEEVESLVNHYFDNFNTLTPPLTSPLEVRGIIKKLPNRKSPGPDQIPNIALKYLPINAITHLTKIYNRCLINCHFPTQWKIANVVMLPKPNQDHKFSQNYRPISLLNTTAKIFERIILNRIKTHCKAIDCIPPEQCGFREGHSTLHQLIRVTNIINEGFASKLYTVGVFLDVKRAFDKMWHDGLTYKMIKLKFPAYLKLFTQQNLPEHHTISTCLFADDSAALTQGVNLKYTIKTMQHFLVKLEKWLTDWRIAINVEKTQAIVFRKWGVIDPQTELSFR